MAPHWRRTTRRSKDKTYVFALALGAVEARSKGVWTADGDEVSPEPFGQCDKVEVDRMPAELIVTMG